MRKYIFPVVAILILLGINQLLNAQDNFEGKIKFKITHENEVNYMDYFIKGDNFRIEMGEEGEGVFIKTPEKSIILMPEEKQYMDMNNSIFSKLPGMSGMNEEVEEKKDFDIDKYKTGKVKNINGFECHQWIFRDEEDEDDDVDEVEAWVTSELGNFFLMSSPMGGGYSPGWGSSVKNNGFFPILVITRDDSGEETSRFEATEINEETLSSKLFAPPSDYSEMKIPGMDSFLK